MREELEKLLAAGKIGRQHVEPLLQLVECGYCMHRSWGFGKITTIDAVFSRIIIDFEGKPGHSMDMAFGAETLKPIPADHVLARKASDLNGLREMAALHHLDLIKLVLKSFGGSATVEQIQQVLVPDVIADDWRKWWDGVKREMKKDGHFLVPLKKSQPLVYLETQISIQDRLMKEFRGARGLKARLVVANELLKNFDDLTDARAVCEEAVGFLNAEISSHQQTQRALALEAIFMRNELAKVANLPPSEDELDASKIWRENPDYAEVFEEMAAAKHKQALISFRETFPEDWVELVLGFINNVSSRLCGECARLLNEHGKLEELKAIVARLVNQHAASSELMLWLSKDRSDTFADIMGPEVFRAMLTAMERDQFSNQKSNRLGDYILDDDALLLTLIESADLDVVKDLTRALQFSPVYDDMDKRSLLARIVKAYPSIQSLITGEQNRQEAGLVVSWESLERRRQEYDQLVHKRIPANSREIAHARSYGDLRENHEYKAAKEMQRLLMKRKAELEQDLGKARGTDFTDTKPDVVGIGSRVHVTELGGQHQEQYRVLGAWDSDPENGVISYLSPVAQALLGHRNGDEVEFELDGAKRHFRIDAVDVYRKADSAPAASSEPEAESEDPADSPEPTGQS